MNLKFGLMLGVLLLGSAKQTWAKHSSYELLRITVQNDEYGNQRRRVDCKITPGYVTYTKTIGKVETKQVLKLDVKGRSEVQKLVEQAYSLQKPSYEYTRGFTNWWVRGSASEEYKLVRHNIGYLNGKRDVKNATGAPGDFLPFFMGTNCLQNF